MKRFVATILFSIALIISGIFLSQRSATSAGLDLSISFKEMQRIAYDEAQLRNDKNWKSETVSAVLSLSGRPLQVLIEALPTKGDKLLSAMSVEVGEDQDFEFRELVLVRKDTEEAQIIMAPPAGAPLEVSKLSLNGKLLTEYILVVQPFYAALLKGQGPLAHRTNEGISISPLSDEFPIMRKLASENEKSFEEANTNIWAVWNNDSKKWIAVGRWPEGWAL